MQINNRGQVMFIADMIGLGVVKSNRSGIWLGLPGTPRVTSPSSAGTSLREIPGIGGTHGAGVNGLGLRYQHGPPKLMLAEGKSAPGLKDGEAISFLGYGGGPFMNRHGQVLIHAEIGKTVGFEHRTDQGMWLTDLCAARSWWRVAARKSISAADKCRRLSRKA